jgi:hypothetical protein
VGVRATAHIGSDELGTTRTSSDRLPLINLKKRDEQHMAQHGGADTTSHLRGAGIDANARIDLKQNLLFKPIPFAALQAQAVAGQG